MILLQKRSFEYVFIPGAQLNMYPQFHIRIAKFYFEMESSHFVWAYDLVKMINLVENTM